MTPDVRRDRQSSVAAVSGPQDRAGGESAAAPAWAYARIEIADADPSWADLGRRLATDLDQLLRPWRTLAVQHVGSTSVPQLPAKPVIDVMVPVRDVRDDGFIAVLTMAGWAHVPPELDGRPHERFFVLPDGARRLAHLHVLDPTSSWRDLITFRDVLRSDPVQRNAYAELKQALAVAHSEDREVYTAAKTRFVADVLDQAAHRDASG